jgi:hypothetical protein
MEDRSSRRIRTLVTRTAHRGFAAYEIGRALKSMMARSDMLLHSEAGYIYGQPRLRKNNFVPTTRSPAVIYPVSMDPDGFRELTPNH